MANFEYTRGCVKITFDQLPQLQPQIIETNNLSWWQHLLNARTPRKYILIQDWCISVSGISAKLDGTIVVPKGTEIDGASIPFPWFVAFITLGILRPMGILLTASIPHDYAFIHGKLNYKQADSEQLQQRVVQRHEVDYLFYQIVKEVNQAPIPAAISWLAVRLGWYWIKYNGKHRTGRFPLLITSLLVLALTGTLFLT